jgi:hypothetical protein
MQAFSGIPLTLILVQVLPTAAISSHFTLYMAVITMFGLLTTWCGAGCNSPIFAEIVAPSKRSLIYAFDRCFEGALAACATPLVGVIAERIFGYDSKRAQVSVSTSFLPLELNGSLWYVADSISGAPLSILSCSVLQQSLAVLECGSRFA